MGTTLQRLVDALRCLPGVGPKSAQRMVFHLLGQKRKQGLHLASCLEEAMNTITHCTLCNNYTDNERCAICQDSQRDHSTVCVVEGPADLSSIEQSGSYKGSYFVLMGKISPLDGLGPNDIALPQLKNRLLSGPVQELILALSPSIEGQTTVLFIRELLKDLSIPISQFAHGIPCGAELEFLDPTTISNALRNRATVSQS